MAGFASYAMADEIFDFYYRGIVPSLPGSLWLRLLVSPSSRAGGGTETNYSGYARLQLPRDTTIFPAALGTGQRTNAVVLQFPTVLSVGNGQLIAFDVVDTSSGAFTRLYNGGPILQPKTVEVNKPPKFRVGALLITF